MFKLFIPAVETFVPQVRIYLFEIQSVQTFFFFTMTFSKQLDIEPYMFFNIIFYIEILVFIILLLFLGTKS